MVHLVNADCVVVANVYDHVVADVVFSLAKDGDVKHVASRAWTG